MPPVIVIVPCYNEATRLQTKEFEAFAAVSGARILFVDDGSQDGTADLLLEMAERHPGRIDVLSLSRNAGKGEAIRTGLRRAIDEGAEVVAYLDADLSTPIEEFERLLEERDRTEADAVLAARVGLLGWDIRRQSHRHYLGRVFATAASFVLGLRVYDTQCGAKVFRVTPHLGRAVSVPFCSPWTFDVELLGRLLAEHARDGDEANFLEVPLRVWADVPGSKLDLASMLHAAFDLLRIRRRLLAWRRLSGNAPTQAPPSEAG